MKLDRVSERVYANTEGKTGGNVGIITCQRRVVAVDSMYPVPGANFKNSIQSLTKKPITHLLLTHVHNDHILGSQAFVEADIVSHFRLKEKMEENLRSIWTKNGLQKMINDMKKTAPERVPMFEGLNIVLPNITFKRSYKIDDIQIVNTGGHTDCSSYVYVEADKVLFAGDNLFVGRFPWAGDPTTDPDRWIKALERYLVLNINSIIPGHGPICDKSEVVKQLKWFREMRRKMKRLISEDLTEEEIVNEKYTLLYPSDRPESVQNSFRVWFKHWKA